MPRPYPEWIDEYSDALYASFRHHDVDSHMPFNAWGLYGLFADLWTDKLHMAVSRFNEKGLKVGDVIDQLPNHMSMKFKCIDLFMCLQMAHAEEAKFRATIDFFIEAIRARLGPGPLWVNNRINAFADVSRVVSEKRLEPADREHAAEIGKIIAGAGVFAHALYSDYFTDLSYDIYGPYDASEQYGETAILIVRAFNDLNPTDLWPEKPPFKYKSIRIFTVYTKIEATPTYTSSQMLYSGSLVDNLAHFQVEADGKHVSALADLKALREALLQEASEFYREYQKLGFEEKKRIWMHQMGYQMKQLFDLVGMDWRPSQEMLDRVAGKDLVPYIATYDMPRPEFEEKFGIKRLKEIYTA